MRMEETVVENVGCGISAQGKWAYPRDGRMEGVVENEFTSVGV